MQFRRTAGSEQMLSEIQKRHSSKGARTGSEANESMHDRASVAGPSSVVPKATENEQSSGLWSMVASVKAKAAKIGKAKQDIHKASSVSSSIRKQSQISADVNSLAKAVAKGAVNGGGRSGAAIHPLASAMGEHLVGAKAEDFKVVQKHKKKRKKKEEDAGQ